MALLTDVPNSSLYVPGVINVDSFGKEVIQGVTPEFEIAQTGKYRGKIANYGYCLGRRSLGWTDVSSQGDISNYLDTSQQANTVVNVGTTYYIRSTSAQDGVGGTGIRSMRINYLDGLGNRTILIVNTNGTTGVSLGNNISFVQYMESETQGSSGAAVGDITISSVSGAPTVAQTIEKISIGDSRSLSGRVKVPAGFSLYLRGWRASAIGARMDTRLRGTVFTNDRSLSTGFHFQQPMYLPDGVSDSEVFHYLKFPEGSELKISAIPGGAPAGNRCDSSFHFFILQN
jgi:hypothetical protein